MATVFVNTRWVQAIFLLVGLVVMGVPSAWARCCEYERSDGVTECWCPATSNPCSLLSREVSSCGGSSGGGGGGSSGGGGDIIYSEPTNGTNCYPNICDSWSACRANGAGGMSTYRDCWTECWTEAACWWFEDDDGRWVRDCEWEFNVYQWRTESKSCCTLANGTCNSGDFPTAAAAVSNGACKYKYSSYTTTNASCGGENITCYHRTGGYSNPVAGVCGTAHGKSFLDTVRSYTSYTQCTTGTASTTVFPAAGAATSWVCQGACGGSSANCSACRNRYPLKQACSTYTDEKGKTRPYVSETGCANTNACWVMPDINYSLNCVDYKQNCYKPQTCAEANSDDVKNVLGNRYLMAAELTLTEPTYKLRQGKNDGDDLACYVRERCEDILDVTTDRATVENEPKYIEANQCEGEGQLAIATPYKDGLHTENACTACVAIAKPFFQIVSGNIYAQESISVGETQLDNVKVMRSADCQRGQLIGASVGIPVAGDRVTQITTERNDAATVSFSNIKLSAEPENYNYFIKRAGFAQESVAEEMPRCSNLDLAGKGNNNFKTIDDSQLCFIKDTTTNNVKLSNLLSDVDLESLTVAENVKLVVFVEGNLLIDREIKLNQAGSFVMFVVSNNIIIDPYLGQFIDESQISCRTPEEASAAACLSQEPEIRAILVASGEIAFESGASKVNNSNLDFWNPTVNRACDKKITVQGSLIGWGDRSESGKGVRIERTFAGCVKGLQSTQPGASYHSYLHNYNACTPVVTVVYDPELVWRLPNWLRKVKRLKLETK